MFSRRLYAFLFATGCYSPNNSPTASSGDEADSSTNGSTGTSPTTTGGQPTSATAPGSDSSGGDASDTAPTSTRGPTSAETSGTSESAEASASSSSADDDPATSGEPVDTSRVVFVALNPGAPLEYGGVEGADSICQAAAVAEGLEGSYLAWLSSSNGDSPDVRFVHDGGPFVRTDGIIVAMDWADLTDGSLIAPINRAADSSEVAGSPDTDVVTHTEADGSFAGGVAPCGGYTADSGVEPDRGDATTIDATWSITGDTWGCANSVSGGASLYCFQQ